MKVKSECIREIRHLLISFFMLLKMLFYNLKIWQSFGKIYLNI